MGLIELQYDKGQTPLDEDEKEGLLIPSVTTRGELDEVEHNGRHSRLMGDIIIERLFRKQVFTWGGYNPLNQGKSRDAYLPGLHEADKENLEPLTKFARS